MGLGWVTGSWGLSSPQCAAAFDDLSFPTECVAEVVGQTLNYVILAGSLVVRLPQIITIFKAQSISGISEASVLVEALSSWLFVIYNLLQRHSFKTWGEALFIGIQNLLLLVLYCRLARPELSKQLQGHCTRAAAALAFLFFACKQQLLPPRAQQIITRLLGASPLPLSKPQSTPGAAAATAARAAQQQQEQQEQQEGEKCSASLFLSLSLSLLSFPSHLVNLVSNVFLAVFRCIRSLLVSVVCLSFFVSSPLSLSVSLSVPLSFSLCLSLFLSLWLSHFPSLLLLVLSRAPQIVKNRQQEHTGHLSLLSLSLNVVGGFARLFTVLQQVPDHYVLLALDAAAASATPAIDATAAAAALSADAVGANAGAAGFAPGAAAIAAAAAALNQQLQGQLLCVQVSCSAALILNMIPALQVRVAAAATAAAATAATATAAATIAAATAAAAAPTATTAATAPAAAAA
ncbi:hypothetical protein Esti_005593 [Eimeria stiedai]